jgi:hypothetical protein
MNRRKILKAIGAVPVTASIGLPLASCDPRRTTFAIAVDKQTI